MIAPVAVNCLNTMTTRMRHMLQSLQYIINKTRERIVTIMMRECII